MSKRTDSGLYLKTAIDAFTYEHCLIRRQLAIVLKLSLFYYIQLAAMLA